MTLTTGNPLQRRFCRQVITVFTLLLLSLTIVSSAQDSARYAVFSGKQSVGRLGDTVSGDHKNCYTVHELTVFEKKVQVIIPVSVTATGGKQRFNEDYTVLQRKSNGEHTLTIESSYTSEKFQLVFSEKGGGRLLNVQKTASASYRHRIAKDDYEDVPSTLICQKSFLKKVQTIPQSIDFRNLNLLNEKTDCFHCPADLSVEECIKLRKSNQPFNWKQK